VYIEDTFFSFCRTLLLWLVSVVLAGVQLSKPSDEEPYRGVGIASGVLLLLAGLFLALTFACIYFGLRRVRTLEGQELQGLDQQSGTAPVIRPVFHCVSRKDHIFRGYVDIVNSSQVTSTFIYFGKNGKRAWEGQG
jgi:hypothetical protein